MARDEQIFVRMYRTEALIAQGHECRYCGARLTRATATADHKTARAKGGSNQAKNIVAACFDCNQTKGAMSEAQYLKAIKQQPAWTTPFAIQRAWMRRKLSLRTKRACAAVERLVR